MQNDLAAFLKEQRRELTLDEDRAQLWRALWLLPGLRPTLEELDIPNPGPDEDRERREIRARPSAICSGRSWWSGPKYSCFLS